MSLPLTIRKNIRDNEPKLKEALEIINNASGKEFTFEADWPTVVGQLDQSNKDRVGELYYKDVMRGLASNVERVCKNETAKEAFVEATNANKITVRVDDKIPRYWDISIKNGEIVVSHKKSIANISELEWFDIVAVLPTPGIPLATKLNIEKFQEKLQENLERINAVTGQSDWQVEVDFPTVLGQLDKNYHDKLGELYYKDILGNVASNLETQLKNEMLKEAFLEAVTEKKIEMNINDKQQTYWDINIKNGALVVTSKKSIANISDVSYYDLAPKIPSPGLPLPTKLNINKEENQTALREALDMINQTTGADDWSVEIDFPALLPQLDKYNQNKMGDLYYHDIMKTLARGISNKLEKSETTKEAFNEATNTHKIIIRINDKNNDYWKVLFQNGTLIVEHKKSIANISNLEYYDYDKVIPVPGALSLVTKLNLEKNKEKLDEALQQISEAAGGDWAVEIDFDAIVPQLDPHSQNNIGDIYYSTVMTNLARCIQKKMENETIKEAFNEATSEKKIQIKLNDKQPKYWTITFQNGTLVVSHKKSIANISELEYYLLEDIIPVPGTFTLIAKLNIEKNREKLQEHLQTISTATGQEYTFDDSSLEAIYPKIDDYSKARIGDIFMDEVMRALARNLEKAMKDEMVLEAWNEIATAHQVSFKHVNPTKNYWDIAIKDGTVVVSFQQIANISNVEYFNIEPLL